MAPATRRACIDVGSNTTALLVADVVDGELTPVGTRRRFTLIGEGAGPDGISEKKLVAAEAAVIELVEFAESLETSLDQIHLIATHVVREAPNGSELCDRVEKVTGIPLEIIDGHAEARFSFIGATGGLDRVKRATVVIDAGGGSTEVSCCTAGGEPVTSSFGIGSAGLQRQFLAGDPPTAQELIDARAYADSVFAELDLAHDCDVALAVGGGASTAQKLLGGVIDQSGIDRVLKLCTETPSAELADHFELEPNRARLLPAGLIILGALSEKLGLELEVGRGGLREGVLLDRSA